jgi:pimeloyl-ACP methyl ester carboxylesterase
VATRTIPGAHPFGTDLAYHVELLERAELDPQIGWRGPWSRTSEAVKALLGLDLSEEPLDLSDEELARISQPTLIVTSVDSPEVLRRVNERLAAALPPTEQVLVTSGHLISPAHPAVLDFVGRVLARPGHIV